MITPDLVQADIVDIRDPASVIPLDLVVDANVLYWIFYANFSSLSNMPVGDYPSTTRSRTTSDTGAERPEQIRSSASRTRL